MKDQQDTVYCVTFPLTSNEYNRIREACEISRGSRLTSNETMEMIVSICYNELHLFTQREWMEATERKLRRDFPGLDIHINAVMGGNCIFNFGSDPTMEERKAVSEKIREYIKEREERPKSNTSITWTADVPPNTTVKIEPVDALWEIVKTLAEKDALAPCETGEQDRCVFCDGHDRYPSIFDHADTCIVARARRLVWRREGRKGSMKGQYIPFNDGHGIVGYSYLCPECGHVTRFTNCEEGCEKCNFSEEHIDPDEWYEEQMKLPLKDRAWARRDTREMEGKNE